MCLQMQAIKDSGLTRVRCHDLMLTISTLRPISQIAYYSRIINLHYLDQNMALTTQDLLD
jgi:hypothetical protein